MTELRAPRVLVVDDERHVRSMLCDALAQWGCRPDGAASASEGLQLFVQGGYDLVMTDFRMPGADGLELIESVRDRDPSVAALRLRRQAAGWGRRRSGSASRPIRKPAPLPGRRIRVRGRLASGPPGPPFRRFTLR